MDTAVTRWPTVHGDGSVTLPEDKVEDVELFKDIDNQELRLQAYVMYMHDKRPAEICTELAVSRHVLTRWISKGNWAARMKGLRETRKEEERVAMEIFRGEERLAEAKDQLKAGRRMSEIVESAMERYADHGKPDELKKLADALAQSRVVTSRAVGLYDQPTVEQQADELPKGVQKAPSCVVIVTQQPGAAPIDVKVTEMP
jgi:hypothetical protein